MNTMAPHSSQEVAVLECYLAQFLGSLDDPWAGRRVEEELEVYHGAPQAVMKDDWLKPWAGG